MLITVAMVGVLATIGTITTSHVVSKTREQKLYSDVETLNRSVAAYIASGGDLSGAESPEEVLSLMKRKFANASRLPGLGGSKIDERLSFTYQTAEEAARGGLRAYWRAGSQRFVLVESGAGGGIKGFVLSDSAPALPAAGPETEGPESKTPFLYAGESTWVWDYTDAVAPVLSGPSDIPVGEIPDSSPPPAALPAAPPASPTTLLAPPGFSLATGAYPITSFDLPLSLHNPNPVGSSDLYYSVNFGNWLLYTSSIRVAPGSVVAAQAIATSSLYRNSPRADQNYTALPVGLLPPVITPSRPKFGLFVDRELTVTLTDVNSTSISRLEYRIGDGPWRSYSGPFTLNRDSHPSGAFVQARAMPVDPNYLASTATLRTLGVEVASITGTVAGSFSNPIGENNMITSLLPGGVSNHFAWGRDYLLPGEKLASGVLLESLKQSSLEFAGSSFNGITSDERFELGGLTYYNGTIISGTGANTVSFSTDLTFLMNGVSQKASFAFDFELINVVNQNDLNNPWADADYVRLANPVASQILDFNGIQYRFQLEFGNSTPNGISLFDEFHVLEGHSATTKVYGTLVEIGQLSFNR